MDWMSAAAIAVSVLSILLNGLTVHYARKARRLRHLAVQLQTTAIRSVAGSSDRSCQLPAR